MAGNRRIGGNNLGRVVPLPQTRKTSLSLTLLEFSHALVLMLWVGSLAGFALVVLPSILTTLPSLEMAIQASMAIFERSAFLGCGAGAFLLLTTLLMHLLSLRDSRTVLSQAGLLLVMIAAAVSAQLLLAPRIAAQLTSMPGPLASLSASDPALVALSRMHAIGIAILIVQIAAGATVVLFAIRRWYNYFPERHARLDKREVRDPSCR